MFIEHFLHQLLRRSIAAIAALLLASGATHGSDSERQLRWVGAWAASQQLVEPRNSLDAADLRDATLRQVVHLSIGGSEVRLRLSNRFGSTTLHVTAAHLARAVNSGSDRILPGSDQALTFSGSPDVSIPAHAEYLSDPVLFKVDPLSDVAITLHIDAAPAEQTGHPGSRATSYFTHGDVVSASELSRAKTAEHWYYIAGIDVVAFAEARAIVVLGDSITDGHGATVNGNNRWPDVLARRLQNEPGTDELAVLNHGIGGNRLLTDGAGPNALSRFDDDVIAQSGVRYVVVLEGVNDIGMLARTSEVSRDEHDAVIRGITGAYQQMIARAHSHDIEAIGATIMPFVGSAFYHPGPASEADRQAINTWIRTPGRFDAVIDFDQITRDPARPDRLLPAYDSGDHLHPSAAGYAAMADAIPLSLFSSVRDPGPKLAITFDDLPAHSSLPEGETRIDVISKLIAALREAHLPPIYGFVNAVRVKEQPADLAVLEAWRSAGNPLGNHTWSHMDLNRHSLEDFEVDVVRDEPILSKLMTDGDWHWFRYPFLAEGDTAQKRSGFRDFLGQRGYKVAAVTMSFADYLWNEPYARCETKGDRAAVAKLENNYLTAASESIEYYRSLSHTLYQRDIPYVLLMHVGAFDAEMLPRLLKLYRSRGFQFVTLPEAERDAFYQVDTDLKIPPGPDMLEQIMNARQLPLPARSDFATQLDSVCR